MPPFPALRPLLRSAAALALALAGCTRRETPAEAGGRTQTLLVGNGAEPADLDPQTIYSGIDAQIVYTLFEGLTRLDPETSRAVPAAAAGWDVSADGLTYTFHLRPGACWSDGNPLTAADFVYSFHRILSPAFAAPYSYMLWPIRNAEAFNAGRLTDFSLVGAKALDGRTLQVTLGAPAPYLPALATHNTWLPVPRAAIERFGRMDQAGTKWTRPGNLVGNGAFTLAEWSPNARIAVVRNPRYWDAAHTRLGRVEFFPYENPDVEELSYRSGQLHATYALPTSKFAVYRDHRPSDLAVDPVLCTFYLLLNVRRPPFDNLKLRQALTHALDREALARNATQGLYPAAHSLTPPDCGGYTPRPQVSDDFALARRLLAEAGFPAGRGLPNLEVQCYQSEIPLRMLEAIQGMWQRELGIHIEIAQIEQKTLFQNLHSGNYLISFSDWTADFLDPLTYLGTMVTANGNNCTGWSNPRYDRLVAEAGEIPDNPRRFELFQGAEAILLEEAPLIPLYFRPQVYARSPKIRGWSTTRVGMHDFSRIWLEP